jgi:hypothetical protein
VHRDDARPLVTRMFLSGQLVAKARAKLDGQRPQLGLLFAAIDYEAEVIPAAVLVAFPGLELIGCTTDGELSSEHGLSEDSAVLCQEMMSVYLAALRGRSPQARKWPFAWRKPLAA